MNGGADRNMLQTLHQLRSISLHPAAPGEFDTDKYILALCAAVRGVPDSGSRSKTRGQKALLFVEAR